MMPLESKRGVDQMAGECTGADGEWQKSLAACHCVESKRCFYELRAKVSGIVGVEKCKSWNHGRSNLGENRRHELSKNAHSGITPCKEILSKNKEETTGMSRGTCREPITCELEKIQGFPEEGHDRKT